MNTPFENIADQAKLYALSYIKFHSNKPENIRRTAIINIMRSFTNPNLHLMSVEANVGLPDLSQRPRDQLVLVKKLDTVPSEIYIYGRKLMGERQYTKLDESKCNGVFFPDSVYSVGSEIVINIDYIPRALYDEIILKQGYLCLNFIVTSTRHKGYVIC
jgi:hypothetical protein